MFGKISYFILCLYIGVNFAMETTRGVDQEFKPKLHCYKSYCCPSGYYLPKGRCLRRGKQAMDTIGKLSETFPEIEAQLLNDGWRYEGEEKLIAAEPTPEDKQTTRADQEFNPKRTCYVGNCCPSGYYSPRRRCYRRSKQAMDTIGKKSETIPAIEAQLLTEGWTYEAQEELIAA